MNMFTSLRLEEKTETSRLFRRDIVQQRL